eukprot:CAMPEP_0170180562 /NCGR_PEP_ID=MMETSP0040_2-20121228/22289_1 /TAXON_ID=641309 /ORGANISM="Lotharella oceanica, Strain CCMP622" /LENGTH=106 /DNA_ID=CAMNT_0010425243 /DNA_START=369 /DNA_END=689 /DNA_ORIENTATION=+
MTPSFSFSTRMMFSATWLIVPKSLSLEIVTGSTVTPNEYFFLVVLLKKTSSLCVLTSLFASLKADGTETVKPVSFEVYVKKLSAPGSSSAHARRRPAQPAVPAVAA